jgi:uncharacterized membrane protein
MRKMSKKILINVIITSILIICPLLTILILKPEFNHEGRQMLSTILPLFWLSINICGAVGSNKEKDNEKVSVMAMWMLTAISLVVQFVLYTRSLDCDMSIQTIFPLFSGAIFILFGNYIPKLSVSKEKMSALSVAMPWLYATINKDPSCSIQANRFAAKVWVLGGIGLTLTVFFQSITFLYADAAIMIAMFAIPVIYACVKFKNKPKTQEVEP